MKDFWKITLCVLCGLLLWGLLKFFIFMGLLGSMMSLSSVASTTITKPHSVYELELRGTVVEYQDENDRMAASFMSALDNDEYAIFGLNDILANIREAKQNPNIDGIYLHGGSMQMGFATAQALREALQDFRESGKFVIAYADNYGQGNYYVATAADSVYLNAIGSLGWSGLGANITFYTKMLEKLGVEMQVVKVGTFKSAVEPFVLTKMSEPNRLQYTTLLEDLWSQVCRDVAVSRDRTTDELNALANLNMALQPQEDYLKNNLVDGLCYPQDIDALLSELTGTDDYELLDYDDMNGVRTENKGHDLKIAVLYAEGDIVDSGNEGIVGGKMVEEIDDLREDDDVVAVVFRVNSGGGSAYASEQIHHALELLKAQKPLVVSMGDYAASGGYYISCNADYIFAEPTTLTGSIGIFGLIPNVKKLTEKIGVSVDGVETHELSNFSSNAVMRGMNAQERALMQAEINRGYDLFTRRCAEGRGKTQDEIKQIAEGRVWSGMRAMDLGLVDNLGSLKNAIDKAAELAQVTDYEVAEYPEAEDIWEKMVKSLQKSTKVSAWLERTIGSEHYRNLRAMESLSEKPSIQARIPYFIEIE
ncbi:MAG: signal peptide peptidase SppA [Paludibacteraceae bacterium]|nr:signal peptide peptidase SppA [Paludibacteraceae bacterium]